jgi:hypothetical protein
MSLRRRVDVLFVALLAAATIFLFATAPRHGEYAWSEAPRNVLNAVFVVDFVRELPLADPVAWAKSYYHRYPALTIGFYPPLFHIVLALLFAVFGASHAVAVACVAAFALALAAGTYALTRTAAPASVAFAAGLLILAAPEVFRWSQQVMLDVPMLALSVWAAYFVQRYGETDRPRDLAVAAALMLAAIYTKQFAGIVALALVFALLAWKGLALFRRAHVWVIGLASLVGLVPLLAMQLVFGQFNLIGVGLVVGPQEGFVSHAISYATDLDAIAGPIALALAIIGLLAALIRPAWRMPRNLASSVGAWFVVGYLVLSLIPHKEPRTGLLLAVPVAVAAAWSLGAVLPRIWRAAGPIAVAIGAFAWTAVDPPTLRVTGYREAAEEVGRIAPPNGRVLFVGNRDGSFIVNLRLAAGRPDLMVVRADKLFLDVAVMPELGLNPRDVPPERIRAMLGDLGIGHVVAVPGIWSEAKVMADLAAILAAPPFREVARVPVSGDAAEKMLVVYRNEGPLKDPPDDFAVELKGHGLTIRR